MLLISLSGKADLTFGSHWSWSSYKPRMAGECCSCVREGLLPSYSGMWVSWHCWHCNASRGSAVILGVHCQVGLPEATPAGHWQHLRSAVRHSIGPFAPPHQLSRHRFLTTRSNPLSESSATVHTPSARTTPITRRSLPRKKALFVSAYVFMAWTPCLGANMEFGCKCEEQQLHASNAHASYCTCHLRSICRPCLVSPGWIFLTIRSCSSFH